jgi:FdhD protein
MINLSGSASVERTVWQVTRDGSRSKRDRIVAEAPLEIRAIFAGGERPVTVTMRTPGADFDLVLGFLVAERLIDSPAQLWAVHTCPARRDVVKIVLDPSVLPRLENVARSFAATSSCGACGKQSLESVLAGVPDEPIRVTDGSVASSALLGIPARLRAAQAIFEGTGGLHAVATFSLDGELIASREDVGRHNAFDKLVGAMLRDGARDLSHCIVALSGRAGFELLQKAAVARAPVVAAIGAPSDLAVEVAEQAGITLVGFLRETGFNVYTHGARVATPAGVAA